MTEIDFEAEARRIVDAGGDNPARAPLIERIADGLRAAYQAGASSPAGSSPVSEARLARLRAVILEAAGGVDGVWTARPGSEIHSPAIWRVYQDLEDQGLIWRTGFARGDRVQFVLNHRDAKLKPSLQ